MIYDANFWTLLKEGLAVGAVAVGFVVIYMLISERQDRRRATWIAQQEREEDEPRGQALVACQKCGKETRVINGLYILACPCSGDAEFKEMGS